MRLDVGSAGATTGLDDVGVERALHEKLDLLLRRDPARGVFEDTDELATDDLPLGLRIADTGERVDETIGRVHHLEAYAGRRDEVTLDLLGLARAQQPVVDEHTSELRSDRALHQRRRDGGVDATRQSRDHPL